MNINKFKRPVNRQLQYKEKPMQLDLFGVYTENIELPECPIACKVMETVKKRADVGMETYGQTMERIDIDTVGWIDNTIEELLDATAYLTRLKMDLLKKD